MSWQEEFNKRYPYAVSVKVKGEWRPHGSASLVSGYEAHKTMDEVFNCSGVMYIEKATGEVVEKIEYLEGK